MALTFVSYLAGYLVAATALTMAVIYGTEPLRVSSDTFEVQLESGSLVRGDLYSGPYVYRASTGELIPATEIEVPGSDYAFAVFVALSPGAEGEAGGAKRVRGQNPGFDDTAMPELYATLDDVRTGKVALLDWGYNFTEDHTAEEVLGDEAEIPADVLPRYDEMAREERAPAVELFARATGVDISRAFGGTEVSNVGYYVYRVRTGEDAAVEFAARMVAGLAPFFIYGGLAWLMFRRFYRIHIAEPLQSLADDAERIAASDLDFSIAPVCGKELGRLAGTLEGMRASLLSAQRELWRTAEGRRRLNAAFAHDLRTPLTVLKGTVEMVRMRIGEGRAIEAGQVEKLSGQIARLEAYASAMGGLSKLEERRLLRADMRAGGVLAALAEHAADVMATGGGPSRSLSWTERLVGGLDDASPVSIDMPLAEEVLGNLLSNARTHAHTAVRTHATLRCDAGRVLLEVRVHDDGDGFTPEALQRGCDPFFSERKGAEHFGLGLNVASILAHLHGGSIELANAAGGGAQVTAVFDVTPDALTKG